MNNNLNWFTSNIKEVFTPTTLKEKRQDIIDSFQKIYGILSPRTHHIADKKVEKREKRLEMKEKKELKSNLSYCFKELLRVWKTRAK